MCMKTHTEKLHEIQTKQTGHFALKKSKSTAAISLKRTNAFIKNEVEIARNKENKMLLSKLVEISKGKYSSILPPLTKRHPSKSKKSLNINFRK